MNLLNKKWINRSKINVAYDEQKMIIENNTNVHQFLVYPHVFKSNSEKEIYIKFEGNVIKGTGCTLKILNRYKTILGQCGLNSVFANKYDYLKYYIVALYVPAMTKIEISRIKMDNFIEDDFYKDLLKNDTLLITPGYPSLENKYNTAFVHTRVQAYKKANFNVDVIVCNEISDLKTYEFEGIKVLKCDYGKLRDILQVKKYKKILIHFFDERYANVLESIDLSDTQLYFYLHGAETLYRDWPKIASPYFGSPAYIDDYLEQKFKVKDFFIKKYNNIKNAKWIFVTEWTKNRCEELLNIKFNNWDVIPCLIDTDLFAFEKKNVDLRKKIFVLRKFDDINSYSLDIVVRIILELSRRPFFEDLQFDIYGDGSLHDVILEPLKQFDNVYIYKRFLNHKEIRETHKTHGIALFPTRFDSQAVSSCEAAASGCAVVTSDIPGVRQFIPENLGVLCAVENYKQYADVIEKMYYDSEYFLNVAKAESQSVSNRFDYEHTISKDLQMLQNAIPQFELPFKEIEKPVLSVIIPSYNVSLYLRHTVYSLLDHRNAGKIEIIIINDGSKDNTADIAEELKNKYTINDKSVIKVINKINGGHGSTINEGIKIATGKYIKVVDGDDTVDSEEFAELIDILEVENSDIVLNNYIEDFSKTNNPVIRKIYDNLKPGIQYRFDDLCYENYGFSSWGPILACSSYKSSMLKNNPFKLSEKMFYVDMELNINVAILCNTITYYNLNIYRYLLGREGQSVNKESYKKHYKDHENVCINMINIYYKNINNISKSRKNYIENKLILPMISTQYEICINYHNSFKPFREFNKRLKEYRYFYQNENITINKVKFHRRTYGYLIFLNTILVRLKLILKKFFRR